MKEENREDKYNIEDKYFKQSIPGLNRLLKLLDIPGEIRGILPTEYQNYRNESKMMDLVFDLDDETLNLEFKSTYVSKKDIINSLDYASYLRIKHDKKTNSYIISTKKKKNDEYGEIWHNDDKYTIPLKTFKEFNAEEKLDRLKNLIDEGKMDDETEELDHLLLIPFMESDKKPKELIVECLKLARISTVNKDKINEIKNLLMFLANKYTDTIEEFEEIERLVKMEGGILESTVRQIKEIYEEKGRKMEKENTERKIQIIERKLKEKGMKTEEIKEITG